MIFFSDYNEEEANAELRNLYNRYRNNDIELCKKTYDELKEVSKLDFWNLLGHILKGFIKKHDLVDSIIKFFRKTLKDRLKIEKHFESLKSFYFLSTVPILTSVHDQKTRYPEFENGNIYRPEYFYTENKLIIKNFDLLTIITENIIQFTENVINGKETFFEKLEN